MKLDLEFSEIAVREWDSKNFKIITASEYYEAEARAGKVSAFAETRVWSSEIQFQFRDLQSWVDWRNRE